MRLSGSEHMRESDVVREGMVTAGNVLPSQDLLNKFTGDIRMPVRA